MRSGAAENRVDIQFSGTDVGVREELGSKMRGNNKTQNVIKEGSGQNYGATITQIERPIQEVEAERRNLDCGLEYSEYCQRILNVGREARNNLEPQHGVTPCRLDAALHNGLSALGYAPQWALPPDCMHWEYQQEPLIVCNEAASNGDWNLYCKDTKNPSKEIEPSIRGVSDFYKHLQTLLVGVPNTIESSLPRYPQYLPSTFPNPDFAPISPLEFPKTSPSSSDFPCWEKPKISNQSLILPNCDSINLKSPQNDPKLSQNQNFPFPLSNPLDLPYDYSIPKKISSKSQKLKKNLSYEKNREQVKSSKIHSRLIDLSSNIEKLDVETVKNEGNIEVRSNLSGGQLSTTSWEEFEMSGQYPGHSRPPVGTPPPQTVWNHLTMTQSQNKGSGGSRGSGGGGGGGGGPPAHESLPRAYERVQSDLSYLLSEVSGLNMHPTGLSGASLNPNFYTHPSMARAASHLTSQLTPQLAHTQAPPTWHTPTVPSKSVAAPNAPGNPLYSLQMLVDNRQNQNQYRNSPGSQSTLDLSATSEMAENYSRMTQDIPISLTARNVDKGSRNGNIISPPIPLNGETSSDSGISSSVPTPNSLSEPVSLSTKELTTPKITVKNFESNLKGVANLHDKIKDINVENFAQKVINLPPSVTIERVVANSDKKDNEQPIKVKDSLSVIAQVPRNVLPVIVNLTSRIDKDVTDSPLRESSSERERKIIDESASVRSPKNLPKRGKKGVDSLLEKLEGGNKKLGSSENIGSVIVTPVEDKDSSSSVKSMSPERQKSKSPTREDDVVSPAFSNDDSNDNTKQRRKRKLEKPVRLSKDSKTEVEDMELEPTEPREPRTATATTTTTTTTSCETLIEETTAKQTATIVADQTKTLTISKVESAPNSRKIERTGQEENHEETVKITRDDEEKNAEIADDAKTEENEPIKRRRSSEGPSTNQTPMSQRTRRKSSDDATEFSKVTSPKGVNNANPFNEVESELEKMFAGIVEEDEKNDETKSEATTIKSSGEVKKEEKLEDGSKNGKENATASDETKDGRNETQQNSTTTTDVTSSTVGTIKPAAKRGKKAKVRGGKRKIARTSENVFGPSASMDEITPKDNKKRKGSKGSKKIVETPTKKNKKNFKPDGLREIAYDSGSNASSIRSRGPVVHVEGPRDSPLSVQVVNAPREDEEEKSKEKRKSVGNGNAGRSKRLSHQNDLDYRGKVSRAGLFSSTLSSRYDAHTTDSTWVCVFCKQGPHSVIAGDPARPHPNLAGPHIAPGTYTVPAGVLSDLFGPYLIGKERLEEGILSADEQEITTEQKKGGKNKRSLRYAGLADQFSAKMGKKKRNSVESVVTGAFTGMIMLPGEEQRWEVWLHEQCALWAAGVYMAGGRVTGLQEAVWDSTKSICGSCGLTGANIGCVKRGCKSVTHYPCALTKGWLLDTNQYIPKCNLHRVT